MKTEAKMIAGTLLLVGALGLGATALSKGCEPDYRTPPSPVPYTGEHTGTIDSLVVRSDHYVRMRLDDSTEVAVGAPTTTAEATQDIRAVKKAFAAKRPIKVRYVAAFSCPGYVPDAPYVAVQLLSGK